MASAMPDGRRRTSDGSTRSSPKTAPMASALRRMMAVEAERHETQHGNVGPATY